MSPWKIQKNGNKYNIIKANTGEIVGISDSKEKAQASIRARYANIDEDFKNKVRNIIKK